MASLSILSQIPLSETLNSCKYVCNSIPNPLSISQNHPFSNGSLQNQLGFLGRPLGRFSLASSDQTDVSVDPIQINEVPILSCLEAIERMRRSRESHESKQQYMAMYSSSFGGITTDPAAMVIPMDDHMVHRGHGVFDTAAIVDGCLYELDQHLDRFLNSAKMAKIKLPFSRESIRRILVQTVSASKCRTGSLRYWLSSGPGDFQLSPAGCRQPALYAIVIKEKSPPDYSGIKVVTSTIPIKPPQFATVKSVNYLPNVLSKMEAEENGSYAAIWLDADGFVAEGPNMNVAFVTKEKELLMPRFDKILSGCTAKRVLVLVEGMVKEGKLRGIRIEDVTVNEGKRADEMMLIGSGVLVRSVLQWDEQVIGDGNEEAEYKLLPGGPSGETNKEVKDLFKEEVTVLENVCWKEFGLLVFVWFSFLALQIAKNYTATCSIEYWVLNLLQIPVAVGVSLYEAISLYSGKRVIASKGDSGSRPGVKQLIIYCLCGVLAGVVGGLLGLGGGFIMGPLFLELGIPPQVSSATATFAMMFSSSMSVVEYYLLKRFPVPYAIYFICVATIAAFVGQHVVRRIINILGRASLIIFILASTIFISAISLGGVGISNMIGNF